MAVFKDNNNETGKSKHYISVLIMIWIEMEKYFLPPHMITFR